MRKLTVTPRINDYSLSMIEDLVGIKFTDYFKEFMKVSAGLNHYECVFISAANIHWEINSFLLFKDIYPLTKELMDSLNRKMVPFAIDGGGWHFCLSAEDDFNAIYINRWTDHKPEEQLLKIADSFEEFVNALKREDEI